MATHVVSQNSRAADLLRLLERVKGDLELYGTVEQFPKMEGRQLIMVLAPKSESLVNSGPSGLPRCIQPQIYMNPDVVEVASFEGNGARWTNTPKPGEKLVEEEIREFCKGQIAHYKIPRYISFVESFPMTVTGKIQKYIMRQQMIAELEQNRNDLDERVKTCARDIIEKRRQRDELMEQLLADIPPPNDRVFDDLAKEFKDGMICPVLPSSVMSSPGPISIGRAPSSPRMIIFLPRSST